MPGGNVTQEQEAAYLDVHVAVCAERYRSLELRLERIKRIVWWSSTMLMPGMGGVIGKLMSMRGVL